MDRTNFLRISQNLNLGDLAGMDYHCLFDKEIRTMLKKYIEQYDNDIEELGDFLFDTIE
jgi:hypothetical protein